MNIKSIPIIIILCATMLSAQVPKKILMEYATNASCPPCATFNPGNYEFLKNNYKSTDAVWYHAWWPGSNDPMYLANTTGNAARINYYGINGVPDYVLNGKDKGWSTNNLTADFMEDHASNMGLESPIYLKVNSTIENDSLKVDVTIKVLGDVSHTDLVLHTAITEQMVIYPEAPGTNGEIDFPHVFRKFCAGHNGDQIPILTIGDSLDYSYNIEMDTLWSADSVNVVAWVQSKSSRQVLQTASDLFSYNIVASSSGIDLLESNSTKIRSYNIENYLEEEINIRVKTVINQNIENWDYTLITNNIPFDSLDVSLSPGSIFNFDFSLNTNATSGIIDIDIIAENLDESKPYQSSTNYTGALIMGNILIVDDDGGEDYDQNFTNYFENEEKIYTKFDVNALAKVQEAIEITNFEYIFWNLGNESPTLENNDATLIQDYVDGGGNFFIAGQDLGYDIHEVTKQSKPRFLYSIYFDASYISNTDSSDQILSVPGNPIIDGLTFELNDVYPLSPDAIQSKRGNSIPILKYSNSDNAAMLVNIREEGKIAYLTFGLEQISSEEIRNTILNSIIYWFDTPTNVDNEINRNIPAKYALDQNFPNPFNPSTTITYQIKDEGKVQIKLFDVLGREIKILVNETKQPGFYSFSYDAKNLNSGVYFYSIKVNDFMSTKKMILLK